jgi:hypothetical protein
VVHLRPEAVTGREEVHPPRRVREQLGASRKESRRLDQEVHPKNAIHRKAVVDSPDLDLKVADFMAVDL